MTSIDYARRHIHQTMAEEEMRHVHTLAIILNLFGTGKLQRDLDKKNFGDTEETIKYLEIQNTLLQENIKKLQEESKEESKDNKKKKKKNTEKFGEDAASTVVDSEKNNEKVFKDSENRPIP